jgi:hypothetical protein
LMERRSISAPKSATSWTRRAKSQRSERRAWVVRKMNRVVWRRITVDSNARMSNLPPDLDQHIL